MSHDIASTGRVVNEVVFEGDSIGDTVTSQGTKEWVREIDTGIEYDDSGALACNARELGIVLECGKADERLISSGRRA